MLYTKQDRKDLRYYRELWKTCKEPWVRSTIQYFENGKQPVSSDPLKEFRVEVSRILDKELKREGISYKRYNKKYDLGFSDHTVLQVWNRSRTIGEMTLQSIKDRLHEIKVERHEKMQN